MLDVMERKVLWEQTAGRCYLVEKVRSALPEMSELKDDSIVVNEKKREGGGSAMEGVRDGGEGWQERIGCKFQEQETGESLVCLRRCREYMVKR